MSRKFLVRSCIATSSILVFATIMMSITGRNPLHARVPDKTDEQTVEQVRKNIQVLKGLPASQLNMVMDYVATSLGVRCQHCHVSDSSGWQYEKDDKQTKNTARKMMQMVMDLNTKNFGGRTAVTCFTCHRGSTEPAKIITLPQPSAKPRQEQTTAVPTFPSVDQILGMYEKALGGTDAMKKITSRMSKGVSVDEQGREAPVEVVQQAPNKYSASVSVREGMQFTRSFNGTNGWMNSPRGAREIPTDELDGFRRIAPLFPISRIRELSKTMQVSQIDAVNGARAYVLAAPVSENTTERYYIDSASGLLLRGVVVTQTMIGDIPEQIDYSNYRAVDGAMIPFTVRTAAVDPRDGSTYKFTSVEQNVPIDEKKFMMLEMKQRRR